MISHKHKCIFIHIPKTAGTSINTFFHPGVNFHYNTPDYERLFGWCPKRKIHMQHATSQQLLELELVTEEEWKEYFKFTFVRNPWDRAYSDYLWIQQFSGVKGSFKDFINKENSFYEILNNNTKSKFLGDHLIPQSHFFDVNGTYELDYTGRFENFETDINVILKKISIDKSFDVFQNRTKRKKNYSNFYTGTYKKLIEKKYSSDIESFGYTFEDNRTGFNILKRYL